MKKKKLFWTAAGLLIFGYASLHSQSITVNEKGGNKTSYTMKEIRKITFSNNDLIVNKKIGTFQSYPTSNILFVDFQNINTVSNTGIKSLAKTSGALVSYPNPFSKSMTIVLPTTQNENVEISLLTLDGRVVYYSKISNAIGNKSTTIDVADIAKGVYICKVQSNGIISTKKIVKN